MSSFKRRRYNGASAIVSHCGDIIVRGTARQLAQKWHELAERERLEGDCSMAERFFQQAEHYRRQQIST